MRYFVLALALASGLSAAIIADVRAAIAEEQFTKGDSLIAEYRKANGVTSEMLEAIAELGEGEILSIEVKHGLPFAMEVEQQPTSNGCRRG